ncbi:hypothetical protein R1sor_001056 [Riccia sorocarpa]|uniref:Uncharacterized protein n=1 Tax=Riccia sorocarpa TaxID=122646 RepID=A0ABD3GYV5_9MARC
MVVRDIAAEIEELFRQEEEEGLDLLLQEELASVGCPATELDPEELFTILDKTVILKTPVARECDVRRTTSIPLEQDEIGSVPVWTSKLWDGECAPPYVNFGVLLGGGDTLYRAGIKVGESGIGKKDVTLGTTVSNLWACSSGHDESYRASNFL